ncbi:MAG: PIG-L family deacetylase [Microthrixaceae bacterium]|nr:PIG-L family deacetylase [Microthrixaceae bacterium]
MSLDLVSKRVMVVSPHYDDAPLSLGQSLVDGDLSRARSVQVRVVFGRTNWSTLLHPTRSRARLITAWRRGEEIAAALRFGYSMKALPLEEVILRTGSMDPDSFRGESSLAEDPLVARVTAMLRSWRRSCDVLLVPAGLGRHVDHRIVAHAGVRALRAGLGPVGFYEDRPYTAYLDSADIAAELAELGLSLEPQDVSGPITERVQRDVRRIYRSQMDDYFLDAQQRDREGGTSERLWVPT